MPSWHDAQLKKIRKGKKAQGKLYFTLKIIYNHPVYNLCADILKGKL
jgi:hypothetical protein